MKEKNITTHDAENLTDFRLGQMDVFRWLDKTFKKQVALIENMEISQLLNMPIEDIIWMKAMVKTDKHYLSELKKIFENFEKEK